METDTASDAAPQVSSEPAVSSYRYRDASLKVIWTTSVPKDDEAALAYFHTVDRFGPDFKPVYCERVVRTEGQSDRYQMLPDIFDPVEKYVKPYGS